MGNLFEKINGGFTSSFPSRERTVSAKDLAVSYFGAKKDGKIIVPQDSGYRETYEAFKSRSYWVDILKLIEKIPSAERAKMKTLDIGSAQGYLVGHLREMGVQAIGVDLSDFALDKSIKHLDERHDEDPHRFAQADMDAHDRKKEKTFSALPFASGTFDFVTALDVLEHTHDFIGAVNEMYRVMKDGAFGVISVPLAGGFFGRIWNLMDPDPTHFSKPTQKKLLEILKEQGFEIIKKQPFFPALGRKWPIPTNLSVVVRKPSIH